MTQVDESTYVIITLGELALVNYLIDNAKIGYNDVYHVAGILHSLPRAINPDAFDQVVRYNTTENQIIWIKKELARNLENFNIPARFAVQCILLANNELQKEQQEKEQEVQENTGEEME